LSRSWFEEEHPNTEAFKALLGPMHDEMGGVIQRGKEDMDGLRVINDCQRSSGLNSNVGIRRFHYLGQRMDSQGADGY
jgi:hypothetical protein